MIATPRKSGPRKTGGRNEKATATASVSQTSVSGGTDDKVTFSPAAADEFAEAVDGAYVVVVCGPAGRYRRRVFLSVASAQRAVDRATARGQSSRIVLSQLTPLYDVSASAVGGA